MQIIQILVKVLPNEYVFIVEYTRWRRVHESAEKIIMSNQTELHPLKVSVVYMNKSNGGSWELAN